MKQISLQHFTKIVEEKVANDNFESINVHESPNSEIIVSFVSRFFRRDVIIYGADYDSIFHSFDSFEYKAIYTRDINEMYYINLVLDNNTFIEIKYYSDSGQKWIHSKCIEAYNKS